MSEEGIESELVMCNIMEGANKTPEFLKMNPLHCIPTMVLLFLPSFLVPTFLKMQPSHLVLHLSLSTALPVEQDDDGFTLWESKAILRYICNKHKLEQWYPADYKKRALCDLALDFLGNSFVKVCGTHAHMLSLLRLRTFAHQHAPRHIFVRPAREKVITLPRRQAPHAKQTCAHTNPVKWFQVIGLKVLYPAAGFAAPVSPEDMTKAEVCVRVECVFL